MPRVPAVIPEPMLARLTDRLPIGQAWSYEVKWDGYRCLALKVGDAVMLRSRNASMIGSTPTHVPSTAGLVHKTPLLAKMHVDCARFPSLGRAV
jgi:ATP-dependent DNA ligase